MTEVVKTSRTDFWRLDDGQYIILLKPEEFDEVEDGATLFSIMGEQKIKGVDEIDKDTRFGHLAWGLPLNIQEDQ